MTFIAGPYIATYNGNSIGEIEEGFDLEVISEGEEIRGSSYAKTVQEGVFQGGNCFISMVLEEFDLTAVRAAFWPLSSVMGRLNQVGVLHSTMALPLVLTKVAGTNAYFNTITSTYAAVPFGFPMHAMLAPKLLTVPLRFRLYPYVSGGNKVFFTYT